MDIWRRDNFLAGKGLRATRPATLLKAWGCTPGKLFSAGPEEINKKSEKHYRLCLALTQTTIYSGSKSAQIIPAPPTQAQAKGPAGSPLYATSRSPSGFIDTNANLTTPFCHSQRSIPVTQTEIVFAGFRKRNGMIVPFRREKIEGAVRKAAEAVARRAGSEPDQDLACRITDRVLGQLDNPL